jgi:molecular chaperone DnaJ
VQGARREIPIQVPGQKPTTVKVDIPAGIDSGQTIQIPVPAGRQGPHMTLLMNVQVLPHKVFEREGPHLHVQAYVSLVDALLGRCVWKGGE